MSFWFGFISFPGFEHINKFCVPCFHRFVLFFDSLMRVMCLLLLNLVMEAMVRYRFLSDV